MSGVHGRCFVCVAEGCNGLGGLGDLICLKCDQVADTADWETGKERYNAAVVLEEGDQFICVAPLCWQYIQKNKDQKYCTVCTRHEPHRSAKKHKTQHQIPQISSVGVSSSSPTRAKINADLQRKLTMVEESSEDKKFEPLPPPSQAELKAITSTNTEVAGTRNVQSDTSTSLVGRCSILAPSLYATSSDDMPCLAQHNNMGAPATVLSKIQHDVEVTKLKQSRKRPRDEPAGAEDDFETVVGAIDADLDFYDPALPPRLWFDCDCDVPDGCIKCWRTALTDQMHGKALTHLKDAKCVLGCSKCVFRENGCKACIKSNVLKLKGAGKGQPLASTLKSCGTGEGCGKGHGKGHSPVRLPQAKPFGYSRGWKLQSC